MTWNGSSGRALELLEGFREEVRAETSAGPFVTGALNASLSAGLLTLQDVQESYFESTPPSTAMSAKERHTKFDMIDEEQLVPAIKRVGASFDDWIGKVREEQERYLSSLVPDLARKPK